MVVGSIHGMSASATIQPAATGAARTPHARLAPMPSLAWDSTLTRAPAPQAHLASTSSSGRTTAITESTAATRFLQAAMPTGVPSGSGAASLPPPKRDALPAASRMPTIGCLRSFRQQPELAVLDDDQHACALVHAVVVGRAHVEHALAADDVLLLLERIAQRDAKRFGAGLGHLERDRDRLLQQQSGVVRVRAERRRVACRTAFRMRSCSCSRLS